MVAGGIPGLQVLLDDGTGTFPFDVTTFARLVEGYTCKRGRQDELSAPTAGDCTLVFDNTDGRFTLGSTIIATPSPIRLDQKIRVKVTPAGGTAVTRYTQAVNTWPVEWPDGSDLFSVAMVSATDVQAKAERRTLLSVIQEEVLLDSPGRYYTLGDPAGATSAADSSGNQAPALTIAGAGAPVVFGSGTGPGTDGLAAATFAGGQYLTTTLTSTEFSSARGFAFWFATTTNDATLRTILLSASGTGNSIAIKNGNLFLGGVDSGRAVADGKVHLVVQLSTWDVYLDNVGTGLGQPFSSVLQLGGSDIAAGNFIGSISHLVVLGAPFTTLPPPPAAIARLAAYYQAGATGFSGESGTARLTRIAGYANVPFGTLDASLTNVAFVDITGSSAMAAMQDVADAEGGVVFFDGSGNLTFHNRNRPVAKTAPDVTIDANFLAEGTRFIVDMQGVINYYEVTAAGSGNGSQVARNTVSELGDGTAANPGHGRYPQSKTFLVLTDQEALDRASWAVSTHAEPASRVGTLQIDVMTMTAAQQQQMLTLEPDSWLRITGLPGQTPGSTTADFVVEGFAEAINVGEWTLTVNAANRAVAAPTPWILDDTTFSVLDSTTRIFY